MSNGSSSGREFGVVPAVVKRVDDPEGEGRVFVKLKESGDDVDGFWAPIASLMSGGDRGFWFMPETEDEVLLAFHKGERQHPYIVGFLHNGEQRPPDQDPQVRKFRSVRGHELIFRDPDVVQGDEGGVVIKDNQGNQIELSNGRIFIQSVGRIDLQAPIVTINGRVVAPVGSPI